MYIELFSKLVRALNKNILDELLIGDVKLMSVSYCIELCCSKYIIRYACSIHIYTKVWVL